MRKLHLHALAVEGFATTADAPDRFAAAAVFPTVNTCPLGCTEYSCYTDCGGGSSITVCPLTQPGTGTV